jgi:hypothetical protein
MKVTAATSGTQTDRATHINERRFLVLDFLQEYTDYGLFRASKQGPAGFKMEFSPVALAGQRLYPWGSSSRIGGCLDIRVLPGVMLGNLRKECDVYNRIRGTLFRAFGKSTERNNDIQC